MQKKNCLALDLQQINKCWVYPFHVEIQNTKIDTRDTDDFSINICDSITLSNRYLN